MKNISDDINDDINDSKGSKKENLLSIKRRSAIEEENIIKKKQDEDKTLTHAVN